MCGKSLKFKTSFVPHSDAQISAGSLNALGFCHVVGYLEIYVNEQVYGVPSKVTSVYIYQKTNQKSFKRFRLPVEFCKSFELKRVNMNNWFMETMQGLVCYIF